MLATTSLKRLAAATLAGGALAMTPVLLPAASAAPDCNYPAAMSSTTTVSVSPSNPTSGRSFTATATVTINGAQSGGPASGGTVAFKYKNQRATVNVVGGSASTTFTAGPGRGQVKATYSGTCIGGVTGVDSSSDGLVLGVEANAGGNGNNRGGAGLAGVDAGSGGTGGLAATGADTKTELLGGLGLGLVAVGGLSLMVHRRRVQA